MSVGGGKGGGSQTTVSDSAAARTLANLSQQFVNETSGIRNNLISNLQEVLSTGGTSLPIVAQAVEASRRAGSEALQSTEEDLARTGLAGTPFGESIRAGTKLESEFNAGQTEQSLAQSLYQMIPNFVLGQSQTALSGLAGAIPGMNTQSTKSSSKGMAIGK